MTSHSREAADAAPAAAPAAPAAAPVAAALAALPGAGGGAPSPRQLLALQGLIGNRAVAAMVQRMVLPVVPTDLLELPTPLHMQTEDERIATIRSELASRWVGALGEWSIEAVWESFGDELPAVAARNPAEWTKSVDVGAEIVHLKVFEPLRASFRQEVIETAQGYMGRNQTLVEQDRARLGLDPIDGEETTFGRMAKEAATGELQELAAQAADVVAAEQGLKQIPVGYEKQREKGLTWTTPENFDPARPPRLTEWPERWKEVKAKWDDVQAERRKIGGQSPGLFALMEYGGDPAEVAAASPEAARAAVGRALDRVEMKIAETREALSSGDLNWMELGAVHEQLYLAAPWKDPVNKSIARGVVEDFEDRQWWTSIGLATLGAAAFLFSELASGGLATFLWASAGVAVAGTQVAMAWESYDDLQSAAAAAASEETRLVSREQVDAAFTAAVLESAFALIDLYGAGKLLRRGGTQIMGELTAAAHARATLGGRGAVLAELDTLTAAEARQAIEEAVRDLGAAEAIRLSGKRVDELAELVGRGSDAGRRLLANEPLLGEGLVGWWRRLADTAERRKAALDALRRLDEVSLEEAHHAAAEALDVLGPSATLQRAGGWERLAAILDSESDAGKRLLAWRDGIGEDLVREFGPDRVAVTGSKSKLSNDMDVSALGADAASDREKIRAWLAARIGTSPDELRRALHCQVFTDPLRMHPADIAALGLSEEVRAQISKAQLRRQEQLVYNHRLYEARVADNSSAVVAIKEEMAGMGIEAIPDFRPLTVSERARLARSVDELHRSLLEAAKTPGADLTKLIDDLADRQAMINVSEGGGYFTGGAARRYVTERDKIPGMAPGKATPAQLGGALLGQLPFLDEAADLMRRALSARSADPTAFEDALKALGKYGERQNRVARELHAVPLPSGPHGLDDLFDGYFEDAAERCAALLAEVRSGGVRSALGRVESAAELRERAALLFERVEGMSRAMRRMLLDHADAGPMVQFAASAAIRRELLVEQVAAYVRFGARLVQEIAEQEIKEAATEGKPAPAGAAAASP